MRLGSVLAFAVTAAFLENLEFVFNLELLFCLRTWSVRMERDPVFFPVAFQFSFWTGETRRFPELNASNSCVCVYSSSSEVAVKIPFLQLALTWRNPFLSGIAVVGEELLHVSASSQLFASLGRYSE